MSMLLLATNSVETPAMAGFSLDEVISPYMGVFFVAFVVSLIATPLMGMIAVRFGVVDKPDLTRKFHGHPIAYLGGVALLIGWLSGVLLSGGITPHTAAVAGHYGSVQFPISMILGAIAVTLVGLMDDVRPMRARFKLLGQIFASLFLVAHGVGTRIIGGMLGSLGSAMNMDIVGSLPPFLIPLLGGLLVVLFVVGACNSTNLLDGLDGLAGGVIAIIAFALTVVAISLAMGLYPGGEPYSLLNDPVRIVFCLALFGAVMGFLPYNFKPANIFMGDAGSMLLGFLAVSMILLLGEKGDPLLVMAGLTIFTVPIMDTLLAIVRRIARRLPLSTPDAHHLHHLLIRSGLGVRRAVIVLYLISLTFAGMGCLMLFTRLRFVAAVFLVVFSFIAIMAFKVGQRQYWAEQARRAAEGMDDAPTSEPAKPRSNPEPTRGSIETALAGNK